MIVRRALEDAGVDKGEKHGRPSWQVARLPIACPRPYGVGSFLTPQVAGATLAGCDVGVDRHLAARSSPALHVVVRWSIVHLEPRFRPSRSWWTPVPRGLFCVFRHETPGTGLARPSGAGGPPQRLLVGCIYSSTWAMGGTVAWRLVRTLLVRSRQGRPP